MCSDCKSGADLFDLRSIDRAQVALVVARPAPCIAHVLPLGAYKALSAFFAGFILDGQGRDWTVYDRYL